MKEADCLNHVFQSSKIMNTVSKNSGQDSNMMTTLMKLENRYSNERNEKHTGIHLNPRYFLISMPKVMTGAVT